MDSTRKVIAVMSERRSGKEFSIFSLAVELACRGKKVGLMDTDITGLHPHYVWSGR